MAHKKFHINNKFEVHECGASVPEKCPFWGNFGNDNHYPDRVSALQAAEKIADKSHTTHHPHRVSPQFVKNRDFLRNALLKYGNVDKSDLPEVGNVKEMIAKWFSGDRQRYSTFKQMIENPNLTQETKKEIAFMLMKGVHIHTNSTVKNINAENSHGTADESEVTIISDTPDKITLNDLKNGGLTAFTIK